MTYLKEPNTNRLVKFENRASIGAGFKDWIEATESEVLSYELEQEKNIKIAQCNNYLALTDWEASAFIKYERPISPTTKSNCLKAVEYKKQIKLCKTKKDLDLIIVEFDSE